MKNSRTTKPSKSASNRTQGSLSACLALALMVALSPVSSEAGQITTSNVHIYLPGPRPGGLGPVPELPQASELRPQAKPKTWRALRDEGVVRQGWDYSCGSAALATLLSTLGDPISEKEILLEALSGLTPEQEQQTMEEGLSLLDLQKVTKGRGHQSAGYRVGPDMLEKLTRPVLVFIKPQGYRHFAVMRGLRKDRVFLADPARGNVRMPLWRFLQMWQGADGKGILFVIGAETPEQLELASDVATRPELAVAQRLMEAGARDIRPAAGLE